MRRRHRDRDAEVLFIDFTRSWKRHKLPQWGRVGGKYTRLEMDFMHI